MADKQIRYELDVDTRQAERDLASLGDTAERVDQDLDQLAGTRRVSVEVQTQGQQQVDGMLERIQTLSAADQRIVLELEAAKAERAADGLLRKLATVADDKVEATLDARDLATVKVDAIRDALATLDAASVDVTIEATDNASDDLRDVADRADTVDKLSPDVTIDATDNASGVLTGIADKLGAGGIGGAAGMLTSPGGALAGIAGGLAAAATAASDLAIEADALATQFNSTPEAVSGLAAVLRTTADVEASDLADIIGQMSQALQENPQHARTLGVTLDQVRRDPVAAFIQAIDTIAADGKFSFAELEAATVAFGEEGVRQVAAVVAAVGPDGLSGAIDDIPEVNLITQDDIEKARDFQREWQGLETSFQSLAHTVGPPVLEFVAGLAEGLNRAADLVGLLADGDFAGFWDEVWNNAGDGAQKFTAAVNGAERQFTTFADMVAEDGDQVARELDVTREELDALVAALEDGVSPAQAWADVMGDDVAPAASSTADATGRAGQAAADYAAAIADSVDELSAEADLLRESIDLLEDKADAQLSANDVFYAQQSAYRSVTEASRRYAEVLEDENASQEDRANALDDVAQAAQDAADADVELMRQTREAAGATLSATEALDIQNATLLEQAAVLQGAERQALVDHIARLNGIPPSVASKILTLIDQGKVDEAEALLNSTSRTRTTLVEVETDQTSLANTADDIARLTAARIVPVRFSLQGQNRQFGGGIFEGVSPGSVAARTAVVAPAAPLPVVTPTVTVNVSAGVIGHGFDVERRVTRATADATRLIGRRVLEVGR